MSAKDHDNEEKHQYFSNFESRILYEFLYLLLALSIFVNRHVIYQDNNGFLQNRAFVVIDYFIYKKFFQFSICVEISFEGSRLFNPIKYVGGYCTTLQRILLTTGSPIRQIRFCGVRNCQLRNLNSHLKVTVFMPFSEIHCFILQ